MASKQKTNACLWVPRFWPAMGGTELHTRELAKVLSADHNVSVITHSTTSEVSGCPLEKDASYTVACSYLDEKVRVERLSINLLARSILQVLSNLHHQFKLIRLIYSGVFYFSLLRHSSFLAKNADVIHFIYNGLTDSAMLAAAVAKRRNIPFVFTPNILDTSTQQHAWNSMRFKYLYKSATRIIALTQFEADWLESQNISREKITVIPYGPILKGKPDARRFRQKTDTGDTRIVLFLSRIVLLKGYDLLLEACSQVWLKHPETRIVFMGPATPDAREAILASADPRILLIEEFDQGVKADALAACDLLCVPSRRESLGVVYIEAALNAKPVVALKLPVLQEVIEDGKDGILVEESPKCVADAVVSLLDAPKMAVQMGQLGYIKSREKFNWQNAKSQISNVYSEVIDEHRNGTSVDNTNPWTAPACERSPRHHPLSSNKD
ncbi:glycosyltransferase family 4 protein [Granulosicoccus sp.]|nr:glycosyltransferase family 4 protein [Granulosicoccus sp.]MDB4224905.1 glycosyltransferase family 4 protein [Granulosicoccus sp.]